MEYRINKEALFEQFIAWDSFLKRKVHLIACGGTAMTLLGIKASTKDIDLLAPNIDEYEYLLKQLKQLGYRSTSGWGWARDKGFVFDIFKGKLIHTTELLESPLKETNNTLIKEFNHVYLGVLNYYDIIISKLFRATSQDIEDCLALINAKQKDINLDLLIKRFKETASFDVSENAVNLNLEHFLRIMKKRGLYGATK